MDIDYKKLTVRISKKDILKLLSENEQQYAHVKYLQGRCNKYLEEVRALKKELEEAQAIIIELEAKKAIIATLGCFPGQL